jgi:nucleoside-diphosphate-sugar epimerase
VSVLIIGGCGYTGSALYSFLRGSGMEISTVDIEWFGNFSNPDNIRCDMRELTDDFLGRFQAIILLAGHSNVQTCLNNRSSTFFNNVSNFIRLLDKIRSDQKIIYARSSN